MIRPIVVVEPKTHRRLRVIDALRGTHPIHPLDAINGALRHIREHRPPVVLIGVGRRTDPALRLARQIRTDGSTPGLIGLIDWSHRLGDPAAVASACGAAGVLQGTPEPDALREFVAQLRAGEPIVVGEPPPRRWPPWRNG